MKKNHVSDLEPEPKAERHAVRGVLRLHRAPAVRRRRRRRGAARCTATRGGRSGCGLRGAAHVAGAEQLGAAQTKQNFSERQRLQQHVEMHRLLGLGAREVPDAAAEQDESAAVVLARKRTIGHQTASCPRCWSCRRWVSAADEQQHAISSQFRQQPRTWHQEEGGNWLA